MADKKDSPKDLGSINTTILVATKDPERSNTQRHIEINELNQDDFKSLRQTDPFMFYSIPRAQRDAIMLEDGGQDNGRRYQMPADYTATQTTSIRRRSAISYEAYPSFEFDDIVNDAQRRSTISSEAYPSFQSDDIANGELGSLLRELAGVSQ